MTFFFYFSVNTDSCFWNCFFFRLSIHSRHLNLCSSSRRFSPLAESFLVLMILAAYSWPDSTFTQRRTTENAPLETQSEEPVSATAFLNDVFLFQLHVLFLFPRVAVSCSYHTEGGVDSGGRTSKSQPFLTSVPSITGPCSKT